MDERINEAILVVGNYQREGSGNIMCVKSPEFSRVFGKQIVTIRRLSTEFLNKNHSCDTLQYQPNNAFHFIWRNKKQWQRSKNSCNQTRYTSQEPRFKTIVLGERKRFIKAVHESPLRVNSSSPLIIVLTVEPNMQIFVLYSSGGVARLVCVNDRFIFLAGSLSSRFFRSWRFVTLLYSVLFDLFPVVSFFFACISQ